jgi:hypothetical protein
MMALPVAPGIRSIWKQRPSPQVIEIPGGRYGFALNTMTVENGSWQRIRNDPQGYYTRPARGSADHRKDKPQAAARPKTKVVPIPVIYPGYLDPDVFDGLELPCLGLGRYFIIPKVFARKQLHFKNDLTGKNYLRVKASLDIPGQAGRLCCPWSVLFLLHLAFRCR